MLRTHDKNLFIYVTSFDKQCLPIPGSVDQADEDNFGVSWHVVQRVIAVKVHSQSRCKIVTGRAKVRLA